MSEAGLYSIRELMAFTYKNEPLVDGLLWERDNIFIIGNEKARKSILAMQLACALTSGQAFLGEYAVAKKCKVLYVQTEGKLLDTKDRLISMMKVNDCDQDNLYVAYYPSIALDTQEGVSTFKADLLKKGFSPEVIILDPLYHSMQGSLTDEADARRMTTNLRALGDHYAATIIVVHHTHKPIRAKDGKIIDEGDDSIFGSFVWKAWADHTLLFRVNKGDKMRVLSCSTQRSGKVVGYEELLLVDKPYLSFDRNLDLNKPYELHIRKAIEDSGATGITRERLSELSKMSLSTVEKSLRKLIQSGEVLKDNERRPVHYWSAYALKVNTPVAVTAVTS